MSASSGAVGARGSAQGKPNTSLKKVVAASVIGTTIEWYDFFVFGVAAALIFNTLFFPSFDPLVGTLLSFATYAIGFVARPIGGLVFGHFGDKIGRKSMLVTTLLIMGVSTVLIGCLPTYGTIGVAAPILLVALRFIQGFALGGEWGGAVLMAAEYGTKGRRGFYASFPQAGAPAGNMLAVGVLSLLTATMSTATFESWGWRVAFLFSGVLVAIGLWIRTTIAESPLFEQSRKAAEEEAKNAATPARAPIFELIKSYRRSVLIAMGARFAENVSYYIFTVFVLTYATKQLDLSRGFVLNAVLVASAIHLVTIPLWGALSDRVGRRPLYMIGAVGVGVWGFVFFALLDTKSWPLMLLALAVGLLFHGAMYGPQAAFFSELFGTRVRYSGASVGYQLASVFAGSLAPIIAVALLASYGTAFPISVYLAATAVVTLVAVFVCRETSGDDLRDDLSETVEHEYSTEPPLAVEDVEQRGGAVAA
jgi:metabolite-proton symporter